MVGEKISQRQAKEARNKKRRRMRVGLDEEEIIWNFGNVQKAYATRGYEAKN
jgi:hypothetical protein